MKKVLLKKRKNNLTVNINEISHLIYFERHLKNKRKTVEKKVFL